jgi:hypothetical protein
MAVVKVGNCSSCSAPNSESMCSATSSEPPSTAGRTCGRTTRRNTAHSLSPSARAVSSRAGSRRRIMATTGRYTSGKYDDTTTSSAPSRPLSVGATEIQA